MDKKLIIALVVLVGLGGILYFQQQKQKEEAAAYTPEKQTEDLPQLGIDEAKTKTVDKIVIKQAGQDGGAPKDVTLEKKGDSWKVTAPVAAEANQTNVKSLLDNLKTLEIKEQIDTGNYDKYGLDDAKALHATFYKGSEVVSDMYFGDAGGRGQMTRIAGKEGVYAVKGYSSFLYGREVKDWRDRALFKFDDKKVKAVEVTNEHGKFVFTKQAGKPAAGDAGKADEAKWTAKFAKAKAPMGTPLKDFEEQKVKDAINAFKNLSADGFGTDKKAADVNLDEPLATITFELEDGAKKTLHFGANAEGTSRWAKVEGEDEIVSVGSWAADWALAEPKKYQKGDDKNADKGGAPPGGMPGGMPDLSGMGMGDPHGGH